MNQILYLIAFFSIILLVGYGVKIYFFYKTNQGKETSSSTIKKAIAALLIGFLAMVGLAPMIANVFVQLLNLIPGIDLKESQSSEVIGGIAFFIFCIAIVSIIYFYYANRHKMYEGDSSNEIKKDQSTLSNISIVNGKNVVANSDIKTKGTLQIGYTKSVGQEINNDGKIEKQINIKRNSGDINLN